MNSMETAPQDKVILIFARWSWPDVNDEDADDDYEWRVAEFDIGIWWSITSNHYKDKAFDPKGWMSLPSSAPAPESA